MTHDTQDENFDLSGEESAILARILNGELAGDLDTDKIRPREVFSPLPQSFSQQRLWILDRLVPGNAFYNLPSAVRIRGQLLPHILEQSLNEMICRHETLRTLFAFVDELPVQVILPELTLKIQPVDLSDLAPLLQEQEIARRLQNEAQTPFDLEQGPLLRVILIKLGQADFVLLQNMHHIISDAWSMGLFIKELSQLHAAFSNGQPSPLAPPVLQYGDFALWQRQRLVGELLEKQLSYWRDLLGGDLPVLELPTDFSRPPVSTYRGGTLCFEIPEPLTTQLLEFNRRENCSLFMNLLTVFNILLCRYSGQEDILVGSPIANRNRSELEGIIGFFANTLVYRTRLSNNPTFRCLLSQVRLQTGRAYDNQDIPFEKLVEELQPERFMNHNPLFQVMFVLQNVPRQVIDIGNLDIQHLSTHSGTAKFDLWLSVTQLQDTLSVAFEYSTDIFAPDTITRLATHFETLLTSIVHNPNTPIQQLEILPAAERHRLLNEFNNTATSYPTDKTLHVLFMEQAQRTPDHIALMDGNANQLSYDELNHQSHQLSYLLLSKGCHPDTIIAIQMERSLEMVISLLAILKSGAAYLPLDPDYPEDRIQYILSDSAVTLLLTTADLAPGCPTGIDIINPLSPFSPPVPEITLPALHPETLAYVIYTSGSTGEPKGAMIAHAGIVNRLYWMQEAYPLTTDDRILQKTPYSFDVSLWEFFWPLIYGAQLIMAVPGGHKDCAYLKETIIRQRITTIHFVPSVLQVFLEEPGVAGIVSLKRVICSGEALPVEYVQRFFSIFKTVPLYNLYGPTEASVDVTAWTCLPHSPYRQVPIGRPIANTRIFILDSYLNPVPIGVPGELHIGGIQLARGYLNRPQLTHDKFCGSPRIYKTGDLVRWLPDGVIEYLGRLDFQVKVRGFRIELGEIESRLREHPAIHDAVVLAAGEPNTTSSKKLVAYVVPAADYWQHEPNLKTLDVFASLVSDWQGVFDETYSADSPHGDPSFNIIGWNSSYTGLPLPAEEMKQWVDSTCQRILSLAPRRILEIGCGTGLFLFPLLPHCLSYIGTDIAEHGLAFIRQQLATLPTHPPVELWHRSAEDFSGLADKHLDLVILNSVVQYFPSATYLVDVLSQAALHIAPGGAIFIGDVRSLPLLKTFFASVEFAQAAPAEKPSDLLPRVLAKLTAEQELVVDPRFFTALMTRVPQIERVQLLHKYGRFTNELSKFRYDVILHIRKNQNTPISEAPPASAILDWELEKPSLAIMRQWLKERAAASPFLEIRNVTNSRLSYDHQLLNWLTSSRQSGTVAQYRQFLAQHKPGGFEPDDFLQLAPEMPHHVSVVLSASGDAFTFDVIFQHPDYVSAALTTPSSCAPEKNPPHSYTNNPLLRKMAVQFIPVWRDYLKESLPEYMVPAHFVLLETFPLTPNGKLDRETLPMYEPARAVLDQENPFLEPQNPTQQTLATLWKELLLLDKLSINDNFFFLGGDSINAIQLISRLNKRGFNLSVRHLYQHMTVAQLAQFIDTHTESPADHCAPPSPAPFIQLPVARETILGLCPVGAEVEDIYPLTPLQAHMLSYFLQNQRENPVPGLFVNQVRMRVPLEPSHIPLLKEAFQQITQAYPYLRTAFLWENLPHPVQVVYKEAMVDIQSFDWRDLSSQEQEKRVQQFIRQDHFRSFQRHVPIVNRITILFLSDNQSLVIKTSDLMRVDGWSAMIVSTRLFEYMSLLAAGNAQPLEPNTLYRDYISWLSQQDQTKGDSFWQAMASGFSHPTPLISHAPCNQDSDGPKEEVGFYYAYHYLTRQQTTALNHFLKQHQILLSALASGIWALLLYHYTHCDRVMFGVLFSGRGSALAAVEAMVGQAINVLPMRVDIAADKPILNWMQSIWNTLIQLHPYETNQLDHIRQLWQRPSNQPLFQSYLVIENFPGIKEKSKVDASGRPNFEYIAQMEYPLRVELQPSPELGLVMQYYHQYFTHVSIRTMLNDFSRLLLAIVSHPQQTVDELLKSLQ